MKNKFSLSGSKFIFLVIMLIMTSYISNAQTSVSIQPDRSKCLGDTVQIPIHITGQNIKSTAFYINYDHAILAPYSTPYINVFPSMVVTGFNPVWNATTMGLFVDASGFSGLNLNNDLLLKLVFTVIGSGTTVVEFRNTPMPYPVSKIWDELGNRITPVAYTGNQISTGIVLPGPGGSISGISSVYQGATNVPYSISPIINASGYQWSLPAGATIASGNNSPSIIVNFSYSAVSGNITVAGTNSCGAGLPSPPFQVNVITQPYITVVTPDGGENWLQGTTYPIIWNDNITEDVKIELYKGGSFLQVIISSTPSTGTYSWTIPGGQTLGADYKIKITSTTDNNVFDFSNADFTIAPSVPPTIIVQGVNIGIGQSQCFNATQTIYVAGSGTSFVVQNGGTATMIAGQNIFYYPGTTVLSGGKMHGYIAPGGPYCGGMAPSMVSNITGEDEKPVASTQNFFRVYPNPMSGNFTIEQIGEKALEKMEVKIFDMIGNCLLSNEIIGEKKHEFLIHNAPAGVYVIRIVTGEKMETIKIIKN